MLKTQYSAENCLEKEKFKSQAQEKQQYAQKNEHDQCVSGEHSGSFNSHKTFKVSDHFQFHLPKLDADKNVWKVNVPKNSNCLFVSVVLAYLIPVKNNDAKFIYRFKKLFPYSESSYVDKEESLKSYNNKLQYAKRLIENYNPFLDAQSIHSDTQWNELIQEFRSRVKVNDLNIWGIDAQIEQIRKLLKTSDDTIREDLQLPELKLFLDVAGSSESGNNSYYRFCLERNIGNQLFSKVILREFVKYFVEEFEARLNAYHMILKGKANNIKKISDEFTEYLRQAVGGMLGGIIGFFLLSATNGVSLGERFAHLLGNKTDEKYHKKRVVELLDLVYYSEKHKDELRKLLIEAGFDIFQSFEMQFIGMTVESENYQEVLRKLAEDATNRAINYYAKNGRECLITEAVMLGKSKIGSFLDISVYISKVKPPWLTIKYKDQLLEQNWNTASMYEKVGLVIEQETHVEYYKRKDKKSKTRKYGYRRLFLSENWNEIKDNYIQDDSIINSRITSYQYPIKREELESALRNILSTININNDSLSENRIKRILSEIKRDIIEEINILKKQSQGADEDTLNKLQIKISKSNINEYLQEFRRRCEETKQEHQLIAKTVKEEGEENRKKHSETHERLEEIKETLEEMKVKLKQVINVEQLTHNAIQFNVVDPTKSFTGREKELEILHDKLQNNGGSVISQVALITDFGGVGKTELARKYVYDYRNDYDDNVIWIDAETEESLVNSFKRLAKELKIPVIEDRKKQAVMQSITTKEQEQTRNIKLIVRDVYKYFNSTKSLFVFDYVDKYEDIKEFLPYLSSDGKKPYILITSRNRDWQMRAEGNIKVTELNNFTPEEAETFIRKSLNIENESQKNEIQRLAELLYHFPLALQQAVAYIDEKRTILRVRGNKKFEINDYIKEYEEEKKKIDLLNFKPRDENEHYIKTVLTTWKFLLNNIKQKGIDGKRALKIIKIAAYFHHKKIPIESFFARLEKDEEKLWNAIELLRRYSIISVEEGISNIHRLVQEVIRVELKKEKKEEEVLREALELINNTDIDSENFSHIRSIWSYASKHDRLVSEFYFHSLYGKNKDTLLHMFAASGNREVIHNILNSVEPAKIINVQNHINSTPLHCAAVNGYLGVVKYLIHKGADLYITDKDGYTPLHRAAQGGALDIVKYFIEKGYFYVDIEGTDDGDCWTSLHWAAMNNHLDIVKYLIGKGADLRIIDKHGYIPLHRAAQGGALKVVRYFIGEEHLSINLAGVKGGYYWTPLHWAAMNGHLGMLKYLVYKNANLYDIDKDGYIPFHRAAQGGALDVVKYFIETKHLDVNFAGADVDNGYCWTSLHWAAYEGRLDIVKYLINKGADLYIIDKDGYIPFHRAVQGGALDVVKYFIETQHLDVNCAGVDVDDSYCWTSLHWAAYKGNLDVVKYLIGKGANVYSVDKYGYTPLHIAAQQGKLNIVQYFCEEKEMSVNEYYYSNYPIYHDKQWEPTPLELAEDNGHYAVASYLKSKDGCYNSCSISGHENSVDNSIFKYGKNNIIWILGSIVQGIYDFVNGIAGVNIMMEYEEAEELNSSLDRKCSPPESHSIDFEEVLSYSFNIRKKFKELISDKCGMQADKLINFTSVQSEVFKAVISGNGNRVPNLLYSYAISAVEQEQAKDLLNTMRTTIESLTKSGETIDRICRTKPLVYLDDIAIKPVSISHTLVNS